jgi:hypothetical protein
MFGDEGKKKPAIKNLIFVNLKGGPSQLELFDGKPQSYFAGPTKYVKSKIENVYFNKTLSGLASFSEHMAVCRMSSPETNHKRGQYYLQSGGNRPLSTFKHPGLCSIVGWAKGKDLSVPSSVAIGSFQGSGYLGAAHAPFGIENLEKTRDLLSGSSSKKQRLDRLDEVRKNFQNLSPYKNYTAMKEGMVTSQRALGLSTNSDFLNALGSSQQVNNYCPNMESTSGSSVVSDTDDFSYNEDNSESFIASCGVAVEMVKIGVPSIQIELAGWDTHSDNFEIHNRLTANLDVGLRQLINGLKQSGKFDSTVIYVSGEFGRTPKISKKEGREDFSEIFCSAIISGAITKGMSFGETDKKGMKIKNAGSVAQVTASILKSMDIDPLQKIHGGKGIVPLKRNLLTFG